MDIDKKIEDFSQTKIRTAFERKHINSEQPAKLYEMLSRNETECNPDVISPTDDSKTSTEHPAFQGLL